MSHSALPDERRECVLLLSCIGTGIKYFLQCSDDFNERYVARSHFFHVLSWIKRTAHFDATPPEFWPSLEPQLRRCAAYVYHEPAWLPDPMYYEVAAEIGELLPAGIPRISIPVPYFHPFWPFQCNDPRNTDSDRPVGRSGAVPF
jgi:hypothetical protein